MTYNPATLRLLRELVDRWTAADEPARGGPSDFDQCEAYSVAIHALAEDLEPEVMAADPVVRDWFGLPARGEGAPAGIS
jgi:hypothetical protein